MSAVELCPVCRGLEPETVNWLLWLGWSPRFVSARWGHTRKAVARHRDECLTGNLRDGTKRDLYKMAGGEGA